MSRKQISWVLILVTLTVTLIVTACGSNTNDSLKPPSVYRNPQVRITHAPTTVVADAVTTVEAEASAFPTDEITDELQDTEESPDEVDQSMMDEVESLLNRVEDQLDRMDTNP